MKTGSIYGEVEVLGEIADCPDWVRVRMANPFTDGLVSEVSMLKSALRYVVKCDECKMEIRRTDSLRESAEGGTCDRCRKPPRKHTRFETCDRHDGWFAGMTRRRKAECYVEGGPGCLAGCRGGLCRLWPGTDMFELSVCYGEMELDWTDEREHVVA